jgi:hypothetical protein
MKAPKSAGSQFGSWCSGELLAMMRSQQTPAVFRNAALEEEQRS